MLAKRVIVYKTVSRVIYLRRDVKQDPGTISVMTCRNGCKARELCTKNNLSILCIYVVQSKYYNNTYLPCYIRDRE